MACTYWEDPVNWENIINCSSKRKVNVQLPRAIWQETKTLKKYIWTWSLCQHTASRLNGSLVAINWNTCSLTMHKQIQFVMLKYIHTFLPDKQDPFVTVNQILYMKTWFWDLPMLSGNLFSRCFERKKANMWNIKGLVCGG